MTDPITIWAPGSIRQASFDRLKDLIRAGAIEYLRERPGAPWLTVRWRDKPWRDGILVDLDEDEVTTAIANYIVSHANAEQSS